MAKVYFCSECIKAGLDLKYVNKYPSDYKIVVMCNHYWSLFIKPKIDKMTKEKVKNPV